MTCSTAQDAEAIYLEYRKYGENGWGPFMHCDDATRQSYLNTEIDRILLGSDLKAKDGVTRFPSAWHAVLFLIRFQSLMLQSNQFQHQCYRGHANPDWPIESTFDRLPEKHKGEHWTASTLFSMYLHQRLYCPDLHEATYVAVARHMGFTTRHLDCTVDPAVAVYFASQQGHNSSEGKVFSFKISNVVENGLEVWCAPPFCDRIYSQLGVFLNPSTERKPSLYSECPAIQFPKPDPSHPFHVWRDGHKIDLLAANPWLLSASEWAKEAAKLHPTAIHSNDLLMDIVDRGVVTNPAAPNNLLLSRPMEKTEWAFRVLDLYHWLFICMKSNGCGRGIDWKIARSIVGQNQAVTSLTVKLLQISKLAHPEHEMHDLDKCLEKILHNPDYNGDFQTPI